MTAGQAARLVVFPTVYAPVSRSPYCYFSLFQPHTAAMVDMDKHACCQLAENGFKNGQWPKDYITWEFLANHPRAMESGYFHLNWNTIPGLYNRKSYLRTLVIKREEWGYLSDPTQLRHYWEPTDDPDDFHRTLGLAVCWTPFHDSPEPGQKKEYVVSVAVVQKTGTASWTTIHSSCGGAPRGC